MKEIFIRLTRIMGLTWLSLAACWLSCDGSQEPTSDWQADIRYFGKTLAERHPDLFFQIPQETFEQQVEAIYQASALLEDYEIVLELARITAMLVKGRDSHTAIMLNNISFVRHLPLRFQWFNDGLFVIGADITHQQVVGQKVIRIGQMPIEEVQNKLADYISHSNGSWAKQLGSIYMALPELLHKIGASEEPDAVVLTLEDETQKTTTLVVEASLQSPVTYLSAYQEEELPLYQQVRESYYWYDYIEAEKTLYVKYHQCREMDSQSFADFSEEVFAFITDHEVDQLVFDIRQNTGGNSEIIWPFIEKVQQHSQLNHKDRFFVVIGGLTFSSGVFACVYLDNRTQATFIGEPTGGRPTARYGNTSRSFSLPKSNIEVSCSSKFFDLSFQWDVEDNPSFLPDLEIERSSDDYFSLKDPVLEYINGR